VLDPHAPRLVGASGEAPVRREGTVGEPPGDTAGGREPAVDPDLADAAGVVSARPQVVLPGAVDLGVETSFERRHRRANLQTSRKKSRN
jgi:hypothetical protein